ncbi:hypothetical protein THAOC_20700 [Thalassiosira oceanica]|uniref:Uncharacterized protein n=1 Tax=Thalassiosira oceanica TaxID=159749 RepID=K0S1J8_THAOC|nr:hypothetical protein THAOC_20700 [Thalassiosira oceanica]|eukprot:EJK59115.1 hypothetical protein THAOC_20700 [Thalassiosira oceanica]
MCAASSALSPKGHFWPLALRRRSKGAIGAFHVCTMEVAEVYSRAESSARSDSGIRRRRRSRDHRRFRPRNKPPIPGRECFQSSLTRRIQILHSPEAILIEQRGKERQRSARVHITGFEIRRFSNSDLHAADSQANYKYVQMDVGTFTDSLSPNIHRSMAIASIIRFACFRLLSDHSLFNRVLPEGLLWQGLLHALLSGIRSIVSCNGFGHYTATEKPAGRISRNVRERDSRSLDRARGGNSPAWPASRRPAWSAPWSSSTAGQAAYRHPRRARDANAVDEEESSRWRRRDGRLQLSEAPSNV